MLDVQIPDGRQLRGGGWTTKCVRLEVIDLDGLPHGNWQPEAMGVCFSVCWCRCVVSDAHASLTVPTNIRRVTDKQRVDCRLWVDG